jgi:hypothetical protein
MNKYQLTENYYDENFKLFCEIGGMIYNKPMSNCIKNYELFKEAKSKTEDKVNDEAEIEKLKEYIQSKFIYFSLIF